MKQLDSKLIALLKNRGIETEEELQEFLSDSPQTTYDPFLLLNMDAGVDLLLSAIDEGDKICIYGDYDADGITSTIVLMEVLGQITKKLTCYIPSRFTEGYGLNKGAIQKIYNAGCRMIVTVDCGSVSVEEVEYAKSLGMKILVTDHHQVSDVRADCLIINPAQPECTYPFKYLAGCGVAFKLAQAVTLEMGLPKQVLNRTLDMVGIGTIGDIVPLVDENRTFAKYGLRAINTGNRKNLGYLIEEAGLTPGQIESMNVSFGIVPNLNAAGRMEHAKHALKLFLEKDQEKARGMAKNLTTYNARRKTIQEQIFRECVTMVEDNYANDEFLLLDPMRSDEGITGIVAGKLKEHYNRPAIIVSKKEDGTCKGTGRSIPGVNLYELLKQDENLFTRFGGHKAACGFSMPTSEIGTLREHLNLHLNEIYSEHPELRNPQDEPELILSGEDLTVEFVNQIQMLAPFGNQNEEPLVQVEAYIGNTSRMGSDKQYLRFQARVDRTYLNCSAFKHADDLERTIKETGKARLIGKISINRWNGKESVQMNVERAESI